MFVAGATGYTGREVVRECVARGLRTVAHVRPDSSRLSDWRARFEDLGAEVDTTPWTLPSIKATLEQLAPTQVWALVGTTKSRGKGSGSNSAVADTYEAVDYGLSVLLLEAALACGSSPRFIYLSAMGADGRPANAYMDVRKRVEAAVRGSGLPFLFARPAFVSGPDREESRPAERAASRVLDAGLGLLGALGAKQLVRRYASFTGADLARAMVALACAGSGRALVAETEDLRAALG